jgi:hypothetical protein
VPDYEDQFETVSIEITKELSKKVIAILLKYDLNDYAESLKESFSRWSGSKAELSLRGIPVTALEEMATLAEADKALVTTLKGIVRVLNNVKTTKIGLLKNLPEALARYLAEDAIDGWLYEQDENNGERVAWVVAEIKYSPPDRQRPAHVSVALKACTAKKKSDTSRRSKDGLTAKYINISADDIVGLTVPALLLKEGYLKETAELKMEYEKYADLFTEYAPLLNHQFTASGKVLDLESGYHGEWFELMPNDKVINDEFLVERSITTTSDNRFWYRYVPNLEATGLFSKAPVHPSILCFDLKRHVNCWVHVGTMKPYEYDASVREKLILPQMHRDLIDILTTDIDVFNEDIVKGKSGGTSILCVGTPGLGKTLTAEVYSEIIKTPLYRVDAGQLGTSSEKVEENLQDILARAERWGAILLLDEADVYIRSRGDDIDQNAIVAGFLRCLEYFNGLMFMTTNRIDAVDDAIVSRMVAVFKYETPDAEMRPKLWKVLSTQFDCKISNPLIKELCEKFPDVSGRDMKQLLRLTKKYVTSKKVPLDFEAFRVCAMFRGLK